MPTLRNNIVRKNIANSYCPLPCQVNQPMGEQNCATALLCCIPARVSGISSQHILLCWVKVIRRVGTHITPTKPPRARSNCPITHILKIYVVGGRYAVALNIWVPLLETLNEQQVCKFTMLAIFLYFPTWQLLAPWVWLVTTHDSFLTGSSLPSLITHTHHVADHCY